MKTIKSCIQLTQIQNKEFQIKTMSITVLMSLIFHIKSFIHSGNIETDKWSSILPIILTEEIIKLMN